jgi:tripartite-type tricarboxylate transporter receptor subunit TctC
MFLEMASAIELHRAGRVRILGITTEKRSPLAPEIPTLIEAGVPDFISDTWNAITAPPKTPKEIVDKLNDAIVQGLHADEVAQRLHRLNMQAEGLNAAQAANFIAADARRWADVIRAANITAQ